MWNSNSAFQRAITPVVLFSIFLITASAALAADVIGAEEAMNEVNANKVLLIDIRTPAEWRQTGVPQGAYLNDVYNSSFLKNLNAKLKGKKDQPIALICARGNRSTWLARELEKLGYSNIKNVREGMLGSNFGAGWIAKGLPVEAASE